jgi:hypothetical protein
LKKAEDPFSPYDISGMKIRAMKNKMEGHNNQWDAMAGTALTSIEKIENLLP